MPDGRYSDLPRCEHGNPQCPYCKVSHEGALQDLAKAFISIIKLLPEPLQTMYLAQMGWEKTKK